MDPGFKHAAVIKKAAEEIKSTSATEATPDKWEEIDDMNRELETLSKHVDKNFDLERGRKAYKERKESQASKATRRERRAEVSTPYSYRGSATSRISRLLGVA